MARMDAVAVDETTGNIASNSLVTIDNNGGHTYHFPGDVVFTGKVFLPNGFLLGYDEVISGNYDPIEGYQPDPGGLLGGGNTRLTCYTYPTNTMDGDYNTDGGEDGFKYELLVGAGIGVMDYDCNTSLHNYGHAMNYGTNSTLIKGKMASGFVDAGEVEVSKVYPFHGADPQNNPQQHPGDFHFWGNMTTVGISEVANQPTAGGDSPLVAERLHWREVEDTAGKPNIGKSIWLKGDVFKDGQANASSTAPELWGQSIVLSGTSNVDSKGLYIQNKGGSINDDGSSKNVEADLRGAGIKVAHGRVEVYDPIRTNATTTKYLELDWHEATEAYAGFSGDALSDEYAIINVNSQALNAGAETNDPDLAYDLHFNFNNDNQAILHKEGHLTLEGDLDSYRASDKRLKDEIKPIEDALDKVNAISGVKFEWNMDEQSFHEGSDIGVIAQEVEEVIPEAVANRKNGFKGVKYELLVPVLIEAVKELSGTVSKLEEKLEKLESSDSDRSTSF